LARSSYQVVLLDEWRRYGIEVAFLNKAIGQSPEEAQAARVMNSDARRPHPKSEILPDRILPFLPHTASGVKK